MRFHATRESFERGEVTVLASIETVGCVCGALALALYLNTPFYFLASLGISPLLLVRTPQSTEMGVRWFAWLERNTLLTHRYSADDSIVRDVHALYAGTLVFDASFLLSRRILYFALYLFVSIFLQLVVVPIGALIVRCACTFIWCYRTRLACIKQIPINWRRIALQTDLTLEPEYVPGYELLGKKWGQAVLRISSFRDVALDKPRKAFQIIRRGSVLSGTAELIFYCGFIVFFYLIVWAPSLLYRYAIKSTSVVWFILDGRSPLWAADWETKRPSLLSRSLWQSPSEWLSRLMAVATIISPVVSQFPQMAKRKIAGQFDAITPLEYLFLFDLHKIPPWGYLALLNAFITITVFFWLGNFYPLVQYSSTNPTDAEASHKVRTWSQWIGTVMRVRRWIARIYLVIVIVHLGLWHMGSLDWLPNIALTLFRTIYGDYLPPHLRAV